MHGPKVLTPILAYPIGYQTNMVLSTIIYTMLYSNQQTIHLANPSWDIGSMMIIFYNITFPKVSKFINMMMMMMMQPCKTLLIDKP
jgi:hypothetical protein